MEILDLLTTGNFGESTVITAVTFILLALVVEIVRELVIKKKK